MGSVDSRTGTPTTRGSLISTTPESTGQVWHGPDRTARASGQSFLRQ